MTKSYADGVGNADADSGVGVGGDAAMLMPSGADGLVPVFMADIGGTLRPAVAPVFGCETGFFELDQTTDSRIRAG